MSKFYSVDDFNRPTSHPWGMLEGYTRAYQKEANLTFLLDASITAGDFVPISMDHKHPTMVEEGLLEEPVEGHYQLTEKALALLHQHYGK